MAEEQEKNIIRLLAKGDEEATGILFRSYHRLLGQPRRCRRHRAGGVYFFVAELEGTEVFGVFGSLSFRGGE